MSIAGTKSRHHAVVVTARALRQSALGLVVGALVMVLLDYMFHWQVTFYMGAEPLRTNPLTFLAILLAFLATLQQRPLQSLKVPEATLWLFVGSLALVFALSEQAVSAVLGPVDLGVMGWNTALTLGLLSGAQILRDLHRDKALILGVLALAPPGVALPGTFKNLDALYGTMSLTTAVALIGLAVANLWPFMRHRKIRGLLRDDGGGRLIRRSILSLILLELGFSLLKRVLGPSDPAMLSALHTLEMFSILVIMMVFGSRLAQLVDRAHQNEQRLLTDLSFDPLTGVATRRAAELSFSRMPRVGKIGILLADIDNFKQVNDSAGHVRGDVALQQVAQSFADRVRLTDLVTRWGGEEFLIILRVPDHASLKLAAERLRLGVKSLPSPVRGRSLTVSIGGVMVARQSDDMLQDLVDLADAALYEAKARGRDCVVLAGSDDPKPSHTERTPRKDSLVA